MVKNFISIKNITESVKQSQGFVLLKAHTKIATPAKGGLAMAEYLNMVTKSLNYNTSKLVLVKRKYR